MTCIDARPQVSSLYDGEPISASAADHIQNCISCRECLRVYAEMGAELRLLAHQGNPVSGLSNELRARLHNRHRPTFLSRRILVPRLALGILSLAALALVPASWAMLRAQSSPLWFQFQLHPSQMSKDKFATIGKAGFENSGMDMFSADAANLPKLNRVGYRIKIDAVERNEVRLKVAAWSFGLGNVVPENFADQINNTPFQTIVYRPGEETEIPIEGGIKLVLHGDVMDHMPKLAWHMPAEPGPDELVITSPILLEGNHVVADLRGSSTIAEGSSGAAFISVPGLGQFSLSLSPNPGAVEAQANWSQLDFSIDGKRYILATGSPIADGDQPHTVWIALDRRLVQAAGLGSGHLPLN